MQKGENYELKQVEVRLKLNESRPLYSDREIFSPDRAIEVMRKALSEMDREYFCVVNLDSNNRPIHFNVVSIGDIDRTPVPVQNVFKSAILSNASRILAFHNHPSGRIYPSKSDVALTEKLVDAGRIMNIPVVDHIIVGGGTGDWFSLRDYDKDLFEPKSHEEAGEYRNIVEYAREKEVDVHVINGYVSAHRDEFVGHIKKGKNGASVDKWALDKLTKYIESRPKDGITRFVRYSKEIGQQREVIMAMEPTIMDQKYKDISDSFQSDSEVGIDVPDMDDGIDDRISVTGGNPSRNPAKTKPKSVKHYSVSKQKSVILDELKKKEAEIEALRQEIKAFDDVIDFSKDVIDPGLDHG